MTFLFSYLLTHPGRMLGSAFQTSRIQPLHTISTATVMVSERISPLLPEGFTVHGAAASVGLPGQVSARNQKPVMVSPLYSKSQILPAGSGLTVGGAPLSPLATSSAPATRSSCCGFTLQPCFHLGGFAQAPQGKLFPNGRVANSPSMLDFPQNLTFSKGLILIS